MFHHARAINEAHATAAWLTADVEGRWRRILKDHVRERLRFEEAAASSLGKVSTDITANGLALLNDLSVKLPPTIADMVKDFPTLRYDLAYFWKHSSAHVHPGSISVGHIDAQSERVMAEQILAGCIRHAAGPYRAIVDRYGVSAPEVVQPLQEAGACAKYTFEIPRTPEAPNDR